VPSPSNLPSQRQHLCVAIHEQALPVVDLPERLIKAAEKGWQDISLMRKSVWQYGAERLRVLLQDQHLRVASLGWAGGFTGSAGFSYREAIEDGRAAVEEAAQIGARTLVIAPGSREGHTFRHAQRVMCDGLRSLADLAEKRHVQLALLTASSHVRQKHWTSVNTLEMAQQILSDVPHPWVGVAVNLERWVEQPAARSQLRRLIPRISLVTTNMWTYPGETPGAARLDTTGLLEDLLTNGFGGVWELHPSQTSASLAVSEQATETFVHDPQIYFNAAIRHRQSGGSVSRW